jgi:DNA-binding NtrC family response regulator
LERAVVIAREQYITTNDLPFKSDFLLEDSDKKSFSALRESLDDLEKKLIIEAMEKTQNNQTKAAEILGISERMLRYKLKKYGLKH